MCLLNYTKCRSRDRCIPDSALCDRKVDCLDEFDEQNCGETVDTYRERIKYPFAIYHSFQIFIVTVGFSYLYKLSVSVIYSNSRF